jgi:hypothetical protein
MYRRESKPHSAQNEMMARNTDDPQTSPLSPQIHFMSAGKCSRGAAAMRLLAFAWCCVVRVLVMDSGPFSRRHRRRSRCCGDLVG